MTATFEAHVVLAFGILGSLVRAWAVGVSSGGLLSLGFRVYVSWLPVTGLGVKGCCRKKMVLGIVKDARTWKRTKPQSLDPCDPRALHPELCNKLWALNPKV